MTLDILPLALCAFLAGLVDAIVGGGGLIQLPALFLLLPDAAAVPLATIFGTNKLSSFCGTSMAVVQYGRRVRLNWHTLLPAALAAFAFSFLGARLVSLLKREAVEPLIVILLAMVAVYTYRRKHLGERHAPRWASHRELQAGVAVGVVIGFYDGFFGPGTGSFLIFIFVSLFGFDFLAASASAKVINFATNLAAVAYFAATDHILYQYALPMGLCNVLGAMAGTRLAMLKGNRFVRTFFLVVVWVLIARLGWNIWRN